MSPAGILHIVEHEKQLPAFAKKHGLRNEYLRKALDLGTPPYRMDHLNWQCLNKVRWHQHTKTGEYVAVVGQQKHFFTSVSAKRADIPMLRESARSAVSYC